jgi:RNA polymerase sigma factor (sigma-70 family)
MEDLELLHRFAALGDRDAITAVIRRYQNLVFSTCLRRIGNATDAEDAMQQVFLAMMKNAGVINSSASQWLYRCSVNISRSIVRSRNNRLHRERTKARQADPWSVNGQPERNEAHEILRQCLRTIDGADHKVLIDNYLHGMTQQDIASAMGVTQQAVAKRLGKTLMRLRRELTAKGVTFSFMLALLSLARRTVAAVLPQTIKTMLAGGSAGAAGAAKLGVAAVIVAAATYEYVEEGHDEAPSGSTPAVSIEEFPAVSDSPPALLMANATSGPAYWLRPRASTGFADDPIANSLRVPQLQRPASVASPSVPEFVDDTAPIRRSESPRWISQTQGELPARRADLAPSFDLSPSFGFSRRSDASSVAGKSGKSEISSANADVDTPTFTAPTLGLVPVVGDTPTSFTDGAARMSPQWLDSSAPGYAENSPVDKDFRSSPRLTFVRSRPLLLRMSTSLFAAQQQYGGFPHSTLAAVGTQIKDVAEVDESSQFPVSVETTSLLPSRITADRWPGVLRIVPIPLDFAAASPVEVLQSIVRPPIKIPITSPVTSPVATPAPSALTTGVPIALTIPAGAAYAAAGSLDGRVINQGYMVASESESPLYLTGLVSGRGSYTGSVVFAGGFSPGNSPAAVAVENAVLAPTNTLTMELSGLTPGSQYDQILISRNLFLGGNLDVELIYGFKPRFGQSFILFNGDFSGEFSQITLPSLDRDLQWDTDSLYTTGSIHVVPEPATLPFLVLAATLLIRCRRHR